MHDPATLILEIHASFRNASAWLVAECDLPDPDVVAIRRTFGRLGEVLHHHHHAEEVMLFPRLTAAGVPAEQLYSDHQALMASIEAVERALVGYEDVPGLLERFDTLLREHLDAEEAIAVPFLRANPWMF